MKHIQLFALIFLSACSGPAFTGDDFAHGLDADSGAPFDAGIGGAPDIDSGVVATGGTLATGGTTGCVVGGLVKGCVYFGGTTSTGGVPVASGGTTSTGGVPAPTGGTSASSGGAPSTGGAPVATGGTTASASGTTQACCGSSCVVCPYTPSAGADCSFTPWGALRLWNRCIDTGQGYACTAVSPTRQCCADSAVPITSCAGLQ